jgi:hypothetical protein
VKFSEQPALVDRRRVMMACPAGSVTFALDEICAPEDKLKYVVISISQNQWPLSNLSPMKKKQKTYVH